MIRQFAAYYKGNLKLFVLDFVCSTIVGLLELAFPIAVAMFIERILPKQDLNVVMLAGLALCIVYLMSAGLTYIVNYWGHALGIRIETEMRKRAFRHLQKLSFSYYDRTKMGPLLARVTKDLEQIGELAHHGPEDLFMAAITFFGAMILMFFLNTELAFVICLIAPLIVWFTTRYGRRMESAWQRILNSIGNFNTRIEDNIGGIRVVQAFTNEEHERVLFDKENDAYMKAKLSAYRYLAASASSLYLSSRFVQIIAMVLGSYFVINGDLSNGSFVGFILLTGVFTRPVEKMIAVLESYTNGIAGFRRYLDFLATEPDIIDAPDAKEMPPPRGRIRYENVTFGYPDKGLVLKNVNFDIQPGQKVAFVGSSGAGKTTLCALLPRFYEVSSGRITIDGHDVRSVTLNSLRSQIGIVQQETFLFGTTFRENIAYGNLQASEAEIIEAAKRAHLWTFIEGLPDGLDTLVGERGLRMSGGQRQRVSIARIFLKNPPIVIFDEATSSLDAETERDIQLSLAELAEGRTTLTITHRMSAVSQADKIFVVGQRGIIEQGTHAELFAREGVYFRLCTAQSVTQQKPRDMASAVG
ncbi:ABC transporter ATP-binding protein [Agrobacterium sp. 22-226-1]